jgi:CheY-like chemotaxis protein
LHDGDWKLDGQRIPVLVLEDEPETRLIYERFLRDSPFQMIPAASIRQARDVMRWVQPRAMVLDILLPGGDAWKWLASLKTNPAMRAIPILVATTVEDQGKGYALGADEYFVKPLQREVLLGALARLTGSEVCLQKPQGPIETGLQPCVLIIDDQAASRYILVKLMREEFLVREASNGVDGLRMAKEIAPRLIFLDLNMPDVSGFELLDQLKGDPITRGIPVAIVTSLVLTEAERSRLENQACAIINKTELSRERLARLLARVSAEPITSTDAAAQEPGAPQ